MIYDPKICLSLQIKTEYSDILLNPTFFSGPQVCRITQVTLYIEIGHHLRERVFKGFELFFDLFSFLILIKCDDLNV